MNNGRRNSQAGKLKGTCTDTSGVVMGRSPKDRLKLQRNPNKTSPSGKPVNSVVTSPPPRSGDTHKKVKVSAQDDFICKTVQEHSIVAPVPVKATHSMLTSSNTPVQPKLSAAATTKLPTTSRLQAPQQVSALGGKRKSGEQTSMNDVKKKSKIAGAQNVLPSMSIFILLKTVF